MSPLRAAAAALRQRAEGYSSDAMMLRHRGDLDDAIICEAIRDELRKVAKDLAEDDAGEPDGPTT